MTIAVTDLGQQAVAVRCTVRPGLRAHGYDLPTEQTVVRDIDLFKPLTIDRVYSNQTDTIYVRLSHRLTDDWFTEDLALDHVFNERASLSPGSSPASHLGIEIQRQVPQEAEHTTKASGKASATGTASASTEQHHHSPKLSWA